MATYLARLLPTARTPNGHHVYCRGHRVGIHFLGDGELRCSGGIVVLPPTVHPCGIQYQWDVPPTKDNLVFIDDLVAAGFYIPDNESPERVIHQAQASIGNGVGW